MLEVEAEQTDARRSKVIRQEDRAIPVREAAEVVETSDGP